MWNSAQPLSLSAKIFLHHRQRLRFAFASQIRSITRRSSTEQAERQLVDPSIFTLASDSGCFIVLSSCVPVYDKHNTKAHKTRPWKHTNTMVQQTRSLHMPMNPNATFVSTQCVLHKERKQELCNKAFEALLCQK